MSNQTDALDNTQHAHETDINTPAGIRTRNPNKRAGADLRLRPLGATFVLFSLRNATAICKASALTVRHPLTEFQ